MAPAFRFMTGATTYRIEAASYEEALAFVLGELKPTPDAEAVIRATLREEITPAPRPEGEPKGEE